MKKLFVIFAVFTALIFVVSCGGSGNKNEDNNQNEDENQSSEVCEYGEYECHGDNSYVCDYSDDDELMWMSFENCSNGCDSSTGKCKGGSNGEQTNTELKEGLYFGIIGFNTEISTQNIGLLDKSTVGSYTRFIDDLKSRDGTGLYFADYTALEMMRNNQRPGKLKNVSLVTFTDGLDNISLLPSGEYNPENYETKKAYRDALHERIINEKIHGKKLAAYTIGLKGNDVKDDAEFQDTLEKLASEPVENYRFEVSDMEEAVERFKKIAEGLYKVSKTVNLDVKVPGGEDPDQLLRFTFDIYCNRDTGICDDNKDGSDSELYIEATFNRKDIALDKISYHGFAKGATKIKFSVQDGAFYHYIFEDIKYADGKTPLSDTDYSRINLWRVTGNGIWDRDSEFKPGSSSKLNEDKSSALIMLVLDCTTSLGDRDFENMQQAAKTFINTLVNGASTTGGDSTTMSECSKDSASGLIWSKKTGSTVTWNDAVSYCDNLTECGYSDWKLPNIDELRTLLIADRVSNNCRVSEENYCLSLSSCWSCSTCTQAGTPANSGTTCTSWGSAYSDGRYSKFGDSEYFWSASSISDYSDSAWNVDFSNATVYNTNKSYGAYVRCVR